MEKENKTLGTERCENIDTLHINKNILNNINRYYLNFSIKQHYLVERLTCFCLSLSSLSAVKKLYLTRELGHYIRTK